MQLLGQRGSLTLRDIVLELGISDATARRDASYLAATGRLTRVYGGVIARGMGEPTFETSETTDRTEKHAIARAAAAMVHDGDTVRITIERVGEMNVKVVQGSLGQTPVFEKPYTPDIIKQR